ncbi:MAG: hypothetical protein HZY76_18550 [Anaerolineae bacterium]|nr:MAG: hypothetical protein HZY76_18550 [Anaerolineae bacterium]
MVTGSAGYATFADGLRDLHDFRLDQAFESAGPGGNPTLTVWLAPAGEWMIALGLGADAATARGGGRRSERSLSGEPVGFVKK